MQGSKEMNFLIESTFKNVEFLIQNMIEEFNPVVTGKHEIEYRAKYFLIAFS